MIWSRLLAVGTALALLSFLSACGLGANSPIDTEALARTVTASSPNIVTTSVTTRLDGLTTNLKIRPMISTDALTAAELEAILRAAMDVATDDVAVIDVRVVDTADEPVDVAATASTLGIEFLEKISSVSYSTNFLEKAFS